MSFREMAYPVGTSEEVLTRGINQFLSYIYNNENLRCVCSSDDVVKIHLSFVLKFVTAPHNTCATMHLHS